MNIVEQAARIIDPEAFSEMKWYDGATGKEHELPALEKARRELRRSTAIHHAVEVLKLAVKTPNLKAQLIADEAQRWRDMGIPGSVMDDAETLKLIAQKFD